VNDGAVTSEHVQALLTELDIPPINMTRARSNPRIKGRQIGRRKPDEGLVEIKTITRPDGRREQLHIHQVDSALGILRRTETGDPYFERCEVVGLTVGENRRRAVRFRPYAILRLPEDIAPRLGQREITVALYTTPKDRARGYNRTAHVRMVARGTPQFSIYADLRGDSESVHDNLKASLYRSRRAHSKGWRRQQVDMLGYAGLVNAITRARLREREAAEAA
jgi:hypothetical protein